MKILFFYTIYVVFVRKKLITRKNELLQIYNQTSDSEINMVVIYRISGKMDLKINSNVIASMVELTGECKFSTLHS